MAWGGGVKADDVGPHGKGGVVQPSDLGQGLSCACRDDGCQEPPRSRSPGSSPSSVASMGARPSLSRLIYLKGRRACSAWIDRANGRALRSRNCCFSVLELGRTRPRGATGGSDVRWLGLPGGNAGDSRRREVSYGTP